MLKRIVPATMILAQMLAAQQVVAPTPAEVGSARGTNVGDYNVTNSFETGYRFLDVAGNSGKYRSDVNYGNGLRLLGSSLSVNSRDGHGRYFDEILLNTLGLGNDPYESATLRVRKNRLYQYDLLWRSDRFFNPALTVSYGEHFIDTQRTLQDHDLVLFPESRLKFRFGYSRNRQTGPALSTIQVFDARGDEFPLFEDVRRERNEYRIGADVDIAGAKLSFLYYRDDFKEDSPFALDGSTLGNNPNDQTTLSQFRRAEPWHGSSPGWLVNLTRNRKIWAVNGRFTYVGGSRNFILDETALGTDRFGAARNRQVVVAGNARRPATTGDLSLSFFPGDRLTLVNYTSFRNNRIDGNSAYEEFNNATQSSSISYFRFLGIRLITNSTDANYRFSKWFSVSGGYHYSARRVEVNEADGVPGFEPDRAVSVQENHLHAGTAGIRIRPLKPLLFALDGEVGRTDHPIAPLSDRNYHTIGARVEYRTRAVTLTTAYRQNYNNNSVSLFTFGSHARNYTANASWTPRAWFGLDAGYTKLHLDTVSGLAFFAGSPRPSLVEGLNSLYVSNIHAGNFGSRFVIGKRVDLYAGYTITRDTGDGRGAAGPAGVTDPVALVFAPVQTFPLSFQSPLARVSVRLHSKLRWNVGWQFYSYREDFGLFAVYQNYHAHTGYTSLLWSF